MAVLAAVGLTVSACGNDNSSTSTQGSSAATVTFGLQPSSATACLKVTDDRGIFRKHRIAMKYATPAPTSAGQIAQVLNGQITAGYGAYTAVISAVGNNLPVVITSGIEKDYERDGTTPDAVIVGKNSGIRSFKQLEGKTVAVNSLQGSWEVLLREAVSKSGGDPSKVKLVAVPFPDQGTVLKSGRVDAVSTLQPFVGQLISEGLKSIGDPQPISFGKPDAITSVSFMSKKFATENPDVIRRFVAASQEGNQWCNAHPDDMKKAIARITKAPLAVVDKTPVPLYDAGIVSAETDTWSKLLVKYRILKEAPSAGEVQWAGASAQ
ncbi:ABC transporter substrate-binding protein [Streptomyces canus]|uniref:ABC transporter substrate-binding protein n=1 Tax=Streptomyces canus TaxID=58343 RepID=UPI000AFFAE3A|nr:ABC transporter substrate-binding protein [Streptomyces canus]